VACPTRPEPIRSAPPLTAQDCTRQPFPEGTGGTRSPASKLPRPRSLSLTRDYSVVGTGVDPVTSRFSGGPTGFS
jgi:hypothetical protein